MGMFRLNLRKIAAGVFCAALSQSVVSAAEPNVSDILAFKPKQAGVPVDVPTAAALSTCKVELVTGKALPGGKQETGWALKDGNGRLLRKFMDTAGDGKVHIWSYYVGGVEAYREIDTNGNGIADQYRWLGPNGSKWGVDKDENGTIDTWIVISPEEVSQEVLAATAAKDSRRLQALLITDEEMNELGLPANEIARIKAKRDKVGEQFNKTTAKLVKLTPEGTVWVHLEVKNPHTTLAEELGSKVDLIRYQRGTVLYQDGDPKNGKTGFLQTGEMIQVGRAWRLVEAPVDGLAAEPIGPIAGSSTDEQIQVPEKAKDIIEKALKPLDEKAPSFGASANEIARYNASRGAIIEQIVAVIDEKDTPAEYKARRDIWVKQIADCYAAAAQVGHEESLKRLGQWRTVIAKNAPGSSLAGYVTFREMTAEYSMKLMALTAPGANPKPEVAQKIQEEWLKKLAAFVSEYPTADDTPDALMQMAMANEFAGKEADAKANYKAIVTNFGKSRLAAKAKGAIDRLESEGKEFELAGNTLGAGTPFDIKNIRGKGKPIVVYYWASWNGQNAAKDFSKLASVINPAQVELVCVNLDNVQADAIEFLKTNKVGGTHLFAPGGLDSSPFAERYGIMVVPTMILLDADGKVVNRQIQTAILEDELKKLAEKK